jgi:hypothetical protein
MRKKNDAHWTDGVLLRMKSTIKSSRATIADRTSGVEETPGVFLAIANSINIPSALNKAAMVTPNHASWADNATL